MRREMKELWEFLGTNGLRWAYLKHLFVRHRRTYAYIFLAAMTAFAIYDNGQQSGKSRDSIVQSGNVVAVVGCNRDFESRQSIREFLKSTQSLKRIAYKRGYITEDAYEDARAFYKKQLAELPLPDCRESSKILSDDIDFASPILKPLYPGMPDAQTREP